MTVVKLWGGLGNQMFQYAFGVFLSKKRSEKAHYYCVDKKNSQKKLAINNLNVEILKKIAIEGILFHFSNVLFYRIQRKLIQKFPFLNKNILIEKDLNYLSNIPNNYVLFDGYWQSYKYLDTIEEELRQSFTFKNKALLNLELYSEILDSNSVSLHIRRGDYLQGKNALIYENCPLEYYLEAIGLFCKKLNFPVFYVFSNDLDWAKKNLIVLENIQLQFVDNSNCEDTAIADLYLMSNCKHHIIANSTFSWWGAWLNPDKNKTVIAPAKWYVGKKNDKTNDLIPPNWIRI